MELKAVLFFSGSILHEKARRGGERVVVGARGDAIRALLPEPLDEPTPLPSEKPSGYTAAWWSEQQEKYARDVEKWRKSNEAWERAGERLRVAAEQDEAVREEYRQIVQSYCSVDYVACVQRYLADFIGESSPAYLLNSGGNVVAHGQTPFKLYSAGTLGPRALKSQVLERGVPLGAFARTASIASWEEKHAWFCPKSVRFMKRIGRSEYDVVEAPTQRNAQPREGWEWAQYKPARGGTTTDPVPNASSRVMTDDFDDFIGKMLASSIGFPVFSICDCNSFHTSGYLWSTYAIRSVMEPGADDAVAILNFDQHPDLGEGEPIGSDKWGKLALKTVNNGCYMSFGNAAKLEQGKYNWSTTFFVRKDKSTENAVGAVPQGRAYGKLTDQQKVQYLTALLVKTKSTWTRVGGLDGETLLTDLEHGGTQKQLPGGPRLDTLSLGWIFSELWKSLSADLGRPFKYVFITIDRDAIQGHQTQWGDASFFEDGKGLVNTIRIVVDTLLAACPGCRFIGLDITGLPESRVVYNQRTDVLVPVDEAWAKVADEVARLQRLGTHYANRHTTLEFALVDAAHSILKALTLDLQMEGVSGCLSVDLRNEIRDLSTTINREYQTAMKLEAKARELSDRIRGPLLGIAKGLEAAVASQPTMRRRARSAFEGAASRITNALHPIDLLRDITGQQGVVHSARPKGFFKGKQTVTFSLTGGGRVR